MKNTAPSRFTDSQLTLFGLLANSLFRENHALPPHTDWIEVYREAMAQTVLISSFSEAGDCSIPAELLVGIKGKLRAAMLRDSRIHYAHTALHTLLTQNGIPYVILKGAASAYYYPMPYMRSMGDVDFYVAPADIPRAREVLQANGYEIQNETHPSHIILTKNSVRFEMHFVPAGVPDGEAGSRIRRILSTLCEEGCTAKNELSTFQNPSPRHHALIMLMHIQHHLLAEGVGLRHLCDWAVFVARYRGEEFPRLFREELAAVGLWRLAELLSLTAALFLGLPREDWMPAGKADEALAVRLMEDIVSGGNFGVKDQQRAYEGMFISDRGKDGVEGSRVGMGIRAMNRIVRSQWPRAGKCPLVLPFGWVYFYLRHLVRSIGKKRKVNPVKAFRKSAERKRFYEALRLYKPEKPS